MSTVILLTYPWILSIHSQKSPPLPLYTSPLHLTIFIGRNSIIYTLMFQMPKPSQSATPYHLSNKAKTLKTSLHKVIQRLYKSSLRFLSFNNTPHISPSNTLPSPDYADVQRSVPHVICRHTMDTSSVYFFLLYMIWRTMGEILFYFLNFISS